MNAAIARIMDQFRGIWRFRWIAVAIAWCVCLIAWPLIFVWPDTFEASARVFVDTRTALSEVTRGISVETNVDSQLMRVRQALLGGPQLQQVARETGLLTGTKTPLEEQKIIDVLRKRIDIEGTLVRDAGPTGTYSISYTNRDRATSLKVVQQLVNTFVEKTLGGKREGSAQAEQFLQTQIAEYERRLSEAEERLADFKKRNVGLMPGTQGDYFTRLQTEIEALSKARANHEVTARRRDELVRQLQGEQPLIAASSESGSLGVVLTSAAPGAAAAPGTMAATSRSASGGVAASDTVALMSGSTASAPAVQPTYGTDIGSRIRETQTRLDELLLRFTDKHPDVIALQATLAELQQRQKAEVDAARRGDPAAAARTGLSANPVYQTIQLQFNQQSVELAAIRAEISDRQRRIAEFRSLVNTAPEVEAEYARLNRDYDVTRAQHHALVERLERARLSQDAEATGIVHFEVIEPPTASFAPIAPNRRLLIVAALALALGAGAGAAYLLNWIRPVFVSTRELKAVTGLPVLGAVCITQLQRYQLRARLGTLAFAGAALGLFMCTALVLLVQSRWTTFITGLRV
jgi:polysaccharide chain length determinant protein (PEP-CTERM system associated)